MEKETLALQRGTLQLRSSLGSLSPDPALGTPKCGAVLAAGGTKMEKDLVSALKEPWWR